MLFGLNVSLTTCRVILTWGTECRSFTKMVGGNSIFRLELFGSPNYHNISFLRSCTISIYLKQRRTHRKRYDWYQLTQKKYMTQLPNRLFLSIKTTILYEKERKFIKLAIKHTQNKLYYWRTLRLSNYRFIKFIEFHIL